MTTQQERIEALQEFGYSEREATFLMLAALHGGYFVRRQYRRFVRCRQGKAVVQLVERMAANSHSRVTVFPNNTGVLRLSSRPLFEALGDPNNRNRRQRSPSAVKAKLMALDSVLADPERTYLATERETVAYFRLEHLFETGQFHALTRDGLIRLKKARRLFSGPDTEALFTLWKKGGDRAVSERIQDDGAFRFPISVDFQTCHLERNYDFLATFTRR